MTFGWMVHFSNKSSIPTEKAFQVGSSPKKSRLWIQQPFHEQNAAAVVVEDQVYKRMIGSEHRRFLWPGGAAKLHHDRRGRGGFRPRFMNIHECLVNDFAD